MKNFISRTALAYLLSFSLFSLASTVHAQAGQPAPYQPRPVQIPKDASYVLPDGSIYIVGVDAMKEVLEKFNEIFVRTHPGFKFKMLLEGSSTGIGGLTAGVSAFAPMGREAWPNDLSGYKEIYGNEPFDIHIGYSGFSRPKHKNPPGIYVNAKNPLSGLTVEQVTRILTTGAAKGDITHWNQLGLTGDWGKRRIHPYGGRDDGMLATSLRYTKMGKLPFTRSYEGFEKGAEIAKAVAEDPNGIALMPFFAIESVPGLKLLPLAEKEGEPFSLPTYENVQAGKYAYTPNLHIYANREKGKPLDPLVKEYARLALSKEGQEIIASLKDSDEGYVPLNAKEVAEELAKLE